MTAFLVINHHQCVRAAALTCPAYTAICKTTAPTMSTPVNPVAPIPFFVFDREIDSSTRRNKLTRNREKRLGIYFAVLFFFFSRIFDFHHARRYVSRAPPLRTRKPVATKRVYTLLRFFFFIRRHIPILFYTHIRTRWNARYIPCVAKEWGGGLGECVDIRVRLNSRFYPSSIKKKVMYSCFSGM